MENKKRYSNYELEEDDNYTGGLSAEAIENLRKREEAFFEYNRELMLKHQEEAKAKNATAVESDSLSESKTSEEAPKQKTKEEYEAEHKQRLKDVADSDFKVSIHSYYYKLKNNYIKQVCKRIPDIVKRFESFESDMSRQGAEKGSQAFVKALEESFIGIKWEARFLDGGSLLEKQKPLASAKKEQVTANNTQITSSVGAGGENLIADVETIVKALYTLGLLSDTESDDQNRIARNSPPKSVEESKIGVTIAAIALFQEKVRRFNKPSDWDGNISGPSSVTLGFMRESKITSDFVQSQIESYPAYRAKIEEAAAAKEAKENEEARIKKIEERAATPGEASKFLDHVKVPLTIAANLAEYCALNPKFAKVVIQQFNPFEQSELIANLIRMMSKTELAQLNSDLLDFLAENIHVYPYLEEFSKLNSVLSDMQKQELREKQQGKESGSKVKGSNNSLEITKGYLTTLGEGRCQYIHWPGTDSSGVTIGIGYDIGSRPQEEVKTTLLAANMSERHADIIMGGAGLKGDAAKKFVAKNKDDVGIIDNAILDALLSNTIGTYTDRAKNVATNTTATTDGDGYYTNARGREIKDNVEEGTYVLTTEQWDDLHPAMIEFITDLSYQGGTYLYDRVAQVNKGLTENHGDHLEQFKAVRKLFTSDYMDKYQEAIKIKPVSSDTTETFFDKEVNLKGEHRRNQIRLAYLDHVITALESGIGVAITNERGDSNNISVQSNISIPETSEVTVETSEVSTETHIVKSGDTLGKIAKKYNVTLEELTTWNNIKNVNAIRVGQSITVQKGNENSQTTNTTEAVSGLTDSDKIKNLYKQFQSNKISMPKMAKQLVPLCANNSAEVLEIMQKLPAKSRDNFAYALADNTSPTELSSFSNDLLSSMSNELGGFFNTTSWEENRLQKAKVDKAMGIKEQLENKNNGEFKATKGDESIDSVYTSQVDNTFRGSNNYTSYKNNINGDNTCNVTTFAMQLKHLSNSEVEIKQSAIDLLLDKGYSGNKDSLQTQQLEDILLRIFIQLGEAYFIKNVNKKIVFGNYGPHQHAQCINHVGEMFKKYVGSSVFLSKITTETKYIIQVKPQLEKGAAVMLSTKLTKGHIVYLDKIYDDGITIHDPFGMRMPSGYAKNDFNMKDRKVRLTSNTKVFNERTKYNTDLRQRINAQLANTKATKFLSNMGERNFYSWAEVSTYDIGKWINILNAK